VSLRRPWKPTPQQERVLAVLRNGPFPVSAMKLILGPGAVDLKMATTVASLKHRKVIELYEDRGPRGDLPPQATLRLTKGRTP
jgi:hypothetical protein